MLYVCEVISNVGKIFDCKLGPRFKSGPTSTCSTVELWVTFFRHTVDRDAEPLV